MKKVFQGWVVFSMLFTLLVAGCGSDSVPTGKNSVVVAKTPIATGDSTCPNGGITVEAGIDTNSNGILDASEVSSTQKVCNGVDGAPGADGTDGVDGASGASVTLENEPAGANCANGGTKISVAGGTPPVSYICNGTNGTDGTNGTNGVDMTAAAKAETCTLCHKTGGLAEVGSLHPGLQAITDYTASIDSVSTAASGTYTRMIVNFTVQDANGDAFANIKNTSGSNLAHLRLGYAKLVPGTGTEPHQWVSYTTGDRTAANLTDNGGGSYTYTSTTNIAYDPDVRNRVMLIVYGSAVPQAKNVFYEITSGGSVVSREVVTTAACNGCHGTLGSALGSASFHSGARNQTKACVVCHTSTLGGGVAEFGPMIHKIHAAKDLSPGDPDWDFTEVTYPQDVRNCATCHQGGAESANWKDRPSRKACGSCHDTVDFATGTGHAGGSQASDANCAACHNAVYVETKHRTENATTNNPNVPSGLANFEYVISSVTVTNNKPVIEFKIKKDGSFVTSLEVYSSSTNTTEMISGFTGGPGFLIAYADGTDTTIDFNNKGKSAAQPTSVNLLDVWKGTAGTLSSDGTGTFTATLTGSTAAFPTGAKMRTVAMQAYFTQKAGTGGIAEDTGRHALSVVKTVTGDTARREVVDPAKCGGCHEWFEGHGGGRVIGDGTTGTIVCTLCHNPNLTSSGRKANVANMSQTEKDKLTAAGYDATNALTFPEASNNFKDMIHGIHASGKRETKYDFVRDRSGGLYYDWSEVTFPGILSNCETCHKPGTYGTVPTGALSTTDLIGGDAATTSAVSALRNTVPNASDKITSPTASTCIMCHDGAMPKTHMEQNGGSIKVPRVQ